MNHFSRYRHWLWLSLVYGFLGGICAPLFENSPSLVMAIIVAGVIFCNVFAIIFLVATWSVLGTGALWKRFLSATALGLIPITATTLSFAINTIPLTGRGDGSLLFIQNAIFSFLFAIIVAQIPFWFFRGALGWQINHQDDAPTNGVTLGEVFLIVTLFAVAITIPSRVSHLNAMSFVPSLEIGDTWAEEVTLPDGTVEFQNTILTQENFESHIQERIRMIEESTLWGFLIGGGVLAAISLLAVPFIWFMLRMQDLVRAWMLSLCYGFLVFGSVAGIIFGLGGGTGQWTYLTVLAIGQVTTISLPLFFFRRNGFELSIRGRRPHEPKSSSPHTEPTQ